MKALFSINALLVLFVAGTFLAYAGEPLQNATIVLKSPDGKTYKTTTDASGKFSFDNIDEDCDGFTVQVKSGSSTYITSSSNKVSVHDISMSSKARESPTKSSLRESPTTSVSKNQEFSTGRFTGKREEGGRHTPFHNKLTLCPNGTGDCDYKSENVCIVELSSDGSTIQGMAITEEGIPAQKTTKKSNK